MDKPIEVYHSALPSVVGTGLRYVLAMIGGILMARGILPEGTNVEALVGAIIAVASGAYGIYRTIFNKKQLVTVANAAPDRVAVVK